MRHLRHLVGTLLLGAIASGCAPTISVGSHVDRGMDFKQYRTFDWGPADALPTGDPRLDQDPFFKDQVQGAVERAMASKGYALSDAPTSDLVIHYHANITRRIDVNRTDRAYGYCVAADCPTEIIEYEAGTLVLDVMDARTGKLVWRGWAQNSVEDMLDDKDAMARIIETAVERMLRQLPRGL